jgi:hypothetical protein
MNKKDIMRINALSRDKWKRRNLHSLQQKSFYQSRQKRKKSICRNAFYSNENLYKERDFEYNQDWWKEENDVIENDINELWWGGECRVTGRAEEGGCR